MGERERRSHLAVDVESKSHEIVSDIKHDIYDLIDCVDVFESIVDELRIPSLKRSEISAYMAKYIYMEDSILDALEKLPKSANTKEMQELLLDATKKFNLLSYEFQETWEAEYWELYENCRKPSKNINNPMASTQYQISKKLLDMQDMAITLTRMSRGSANNHASDTERDPFMIVDEEAAKYQQPTITPVQKQRECQCSLI